MLNAQIQGLAEALFKEAGGGITPWHQDQYYWPLDRPDTITMWMPLVDLAPEMGVMKFASKSHAGGMLENLAISDKSEEAYDRFVTEAQSQTSTYDMYIGVTPFLEMISMANSGTIEPWDPYLPEGLLDDIQPSIREEGSYNGSFYVWPFLLDVIVQGWNADIVSKAGLDPEVAPKNWDEYLANARKVVESGVASSGSSAFDCFSPITAWVASAIAPTTGTSRSSSGRLMRAPSPRRGRPLPRSQPAATRLGGAPRCAGGTG